MVSYSEDTFGYTWSSYARKVKGPPDGAGDFDSICNKFGEMAKDCQVVQKYQNLGGEHPGK